MDCFTAHPIYIYIFPFVALISPFATQLSNRGVQVATSCHNSKSDTWIKGVALPMKSAK